MTGATEPTVRPVPEDYGSVTPYVDGMRVAQETLDHDLRGRTPKSVRG